MTYSKIVGASALALALAVPVAFAHAGKPGPCAIRLRPHRL